MHSGNKTIADFHRIPPIFRSLRAVLTARDFSRTLFAVMSAAQTVDAGNLSVRADVETHDELGYLGTSINSMAAAIEKSRSAARLAQEELRQLNAELEQSVRKRTSQLERANRLLAEEASETQAANLALRESETRKRAIVETALDAVITIERDGKIVEFNESAERIFGYNRADVIGHAMDELIIPPSLREAHRRAFARYLGQQTLGCPAYDREFNGLVKSGAGPPSRTKPPTTAPGTSAKTTMLINQVY